MLLDFIRLLLYKDETPNMKGKVKEALLLMVAVELRSRSE
jgi:hypothetical protein